MERKGQQQGPMEQITKVAVLRSDQITSLVPIHGKPEEEEVYQRVSPVHRSTLFICYLV